MKLGSHRYWVQVFASSALVLAIPAQGVETIGFSIDRDTLAPVGLAERVTDLEQQIGLNLQSQGYAIAPGKGESSRIEVLLGPIVKKATPVGLSFSMGNSDPRATEFQRAFVVPITCRWQAKGKEALQITQEIAVNGSPGADPYKLSAKDAVDNIGSVCMTLLTDQQVPVGMPVTAQAWTPPLRVEVRDKASGKLLSPAPVAVPASTNHVAAEPSPAPAVEEAETAKPEPTATTAIETTATGNDGRKKLIIHNLGNPLELEFGYERR